MVRYGSIAGVAGIVVLAATLLACDGKRAPAEKAAEPASPPAARAAPPSPAEAPIETATSDPAPGGKRAARTLPIPVGESPELPVESAQSSPAPVNRPPGNLVAPPADSGTGTHALEWRPPARWMAETPSSPMRRAQYRIPGPAGDGECAVFYFGPGQGGDPMANAERWAGQFTRPDGSPVGDSMKTRTYAVGDVSVLEVEVEGTYDGGQTMTVTPPKPKPGYMLLGAIAAGPDANWFFKFTGPEATVRAERGAFEEMIRSLRSGSGS